MVSLLSLCTRVHGSKDNERHQRKVVMRKFSLVWMVLAAAPMLFAAGGDEEAGAGSDVDSGAELLIWADETRAPVL